MRTTVTLATDSGACLPALLFWVVAALAGWALFLRERVILRRHTVERADWPAPSFSTRSTWQPWPPPMVVA